MVVSDGPRDVTVGRLAPDFTLPAAAGGEVSLGSYRGRSCVVLVFLRGFF